MLRIDNSLVSFAPEKVNINSFSFVKSYLLFSVAAISLSALCITAFVPAKLLPVVLGVVALAILYILKKELIYEITLINSILTTKAWWNRITDRIFLGAIPLEHQREQIQALGVTHVITLLEEFELKKGAVRPIAPELWQKSGVQHKWIKAKDFAPLSFTTLSEGVEYIHKEMEKNASAKFYIHCKAGRGRSAALVMCYLSKYGSIQDPFKFVKTCRPEVRFSKEQMAAVNNFCTTDD